MNEQTSTRKRVLFSFLAPNEGYIDVEASSDEEATKIVTELMGPNYKELRIVDIREAPVAQMEHHGHLN